MLSPEYRDNARPSSQTIKEVLPKCGMLFAEESAQAILCKPKLMPLKSVTLEKLDKMQKEAQETVKQQELQKLAEEEEKIA